VEVYGYFSYKNIAFAAKLEIRFKGRARDGRAKNCKCSIGARQWSLRKTPRTETAQNLAEGIDDEIRLSGVLSTLDYARGSLGDLDGAIKAIERALVLADRRSDAHVTVRIIFFDASSCIGGAPIELRKTTGIHSSSCDPSGAVHICCAGSQDNELSARRVSSGSRSGC
jgi:hypothetical protein